MANGPTPKMRKRLLGLVAIIMLLSFIGLIAQLAIIQLRDNDKYQKLATNQQLRDTSITAKRGTIYDRNMNELAKSATVWAVVISPAYITDDKTRESIAKNLSEILLLDYAKVFEKTKKKSYYEIVKRKVEAPEADKIRKYIADNKINCISLTEDSKRYYPYGNFAATILGFTGVDNQGLSGLEAYYDGYLKGSPGRVVAAKNAWGTDMPFQYEKMYDAKDGQSIVLTIDEGVQHFLEKHLDTAVRENKVKNRAVGIVMDVTTGEILAIANKPDFDPNKPFDIYDETAKEALALLTGDAYTTKLQEEQQLQWRNKAVSDTYEPGSVFKIVTSGMALEEGVVDDHDRFHCPGYLVVADRTIRCWKHPPGHGTETFIEGIKNSCNPVFMAVAERLGSANFFKYFKAFGLTEQTGVDLPGEASGIYHTEKGLGPVELAVSSFGQTFKVTPMQMITAAASVVNGGKLIEPHIVKQIVDSNSNIIKSMEPNIKRQVLSEKVSKQVALALEKVVSEGSGKNAYIPGYRIGGKTGTSEKTDKRGPNGEVNAWIASFLAIAPADDPKIAVLVLLDEPQVGTTYGSVIAAPVVGGILSDVLPYLGIQPKFTAEEMAVLDVTVPNLVGQKPHESQSIITQRGLKSKIVGSGSAVVKQTPAAGQKIPKGCTVILYTDNVTAETDITVPNVMGMTGLVANKTLVNYGLNIRIVGGGYDDINSVAVKQTPEAGAKVKQGTVVSLEFRYNGADIE